MYLTRLGANDPNFNLRRDPAYMIRKKGKDQLFVSVIEMHGRFDPVAEFATNSYPAVQNIRLLQNNADYTVVEILLKEKKMVLAQCNKEFSRQAKHSISYQGNSVRWTGPYVVLFDGKPYN